MQNKVKNIVEALCHQRNLEDLPCEFNAVDSMIISAARSQAEIISKRLMTGSTDMNSRIGDVIGFNADARMRLKKRYRGCLGNNSEQFIQNN